MSRYTRNTVIVALVEGTYGTDITPTGTNAMLASKPQITPLSASNQARDVLVGYLGQKEELVGARFVQCSFDIELVGSGTAGTRPAWGDLMLACAWAEAVTAVTRVDYTPISTAFQSVSLYWFDDGVRHKLIGARGDVSISMNINGIPVLSFAFKGLYTTPTATANLTPTVSGFMVPQVVNKQNSADLTFGGTHTPSGAPAITGGTVYPSRGIEFALGNQVDHVPLLTTESIEVTQRAATCKFSVDLTAAQEVTFMGYVEAATLNSVGLVHGTAAGKKTLLWLPNVQLVNPTLTDVNGKRLVSFDGRAVPSAGNDEARLVLF
jgi:hypothetical protein